MELKHMGDYDRNIFVLSIPSVDKRTHSINVVIVVWYNRFGK
jgi:hypothetical protein